MSEPQGLALFLIAWLGTSPIVLAVWERDTTVRGNLMVAAVTWTLTTLLVLGFAWVFRHATHG